MDGALPQQKGAPAWLRDSLEAAPGRDRVAGAALGGQPVHASTVPEPFAISGGCAGPSVRPVLAAWSVLLGYGACALFHVIAG
jgi:hypothetical protein